LSFGWSHIEIAFIIHIINSENIIAMRKYGFSFSWKRAVGISGAKQSFARKTGIPTTQQGLERKVGASILSILAGLFFGKK
jgi:hypothetical protein